MDTESLDMLSEYCDEFLIHAADVEGLCKGIDEDLVQSKAACLDGFQKADLCEIELGEWATIPTTYAGGAKCKCIPI